MLAAAFRLLDVDYTQWKSLTMTAIRLDVRAGSGFMNQRQRGGLWSLLGLLLFYALMGFLFGVLVYTKKDVFLTATLYYSFIMLMISAVILIEFHSVVISPQDYAILAYRPVSSQTYFFARLANVLFYTTILATALGLAPMLAYFVTLGFQPLLGIAAVLGTYICSTLATFSMILLYAVVLRFAHPSSLRRALSYLQLSMSFLLYGGWILLPRLFEPASLLSQSIPKTPLTLLYPPTWFASYLDLARGRWGAAELIPAAVSLLALVTLVGFISKRLSFSYSERLAQITGEEVRKIKPVSQNERKPFFLFRRNEGRAVALLIRNQFKFDQRFRLSVLSILPLTFFYILLGLDEGPLPDPFVNASIRMGDSGLLYLAVLLFPATLKASLVNSDAFQASWIYHTTPASKEVLVRRTKDFVFCFFLLPYLLLVGAIFVYFFENLTHVAIHTLVLTAVAHFFLQLSVLVEPALPFSQPVKKGQTSFRLLLIVGMAPVVTIGLFPIIFRVGYSSWLSILVLFLSLGALTVLLEWLIGKRVRSSQ